MYVFQGRYCVSQSKEAALKRPEEWRVGGSQLGRPAYYMCIRGWRGRGAFSKDGQPKGSNEVERTPANPVAICNYAGADCRGREVKATHRRTSTASRRSAASGRPVRVSGAGGRGRLPIRRR
jgi:hypothetical protein